MFSSSQVGGWDQTNIGLWCINSMCRSASLKHKSKKNKGLIPWDGSLFWVRADRMLGAVVIAENSEIIESRNSYESGSGSESSDGSHSGLRLPSSPKNSCFTFSTFSVMVASTVNSDPSSLRALGVKISSSSSWPGRFLIFIDGVRNSESRSVGMPSLIRFVGWNPPLIR